MSKARDRDAGQGLKNAAAAAAVAAVILASVFLPARLSAISDRSLLDTVQKETGDNSPESFGFSLSAPERLYILSKALGSRNILQSDYAASLREKAMRASADAGSASYAYVENGYGPAQDEMSAEGAMRSCEAELAAIARDGLGVDGFRISNPCGQTLYSAVDMLEPRKNVSVWQIEYDGGLPPPGAPFALMEAYVDAGTGKVYGFAFRAAELADFDAERLARAWLGRLGIAGFTDITENGPLPEAEDRRQKFATDGMDQEKTVFEAGFYAGVNEYYVSCY